MVKISEATNYECSCGWKGPETELNIKTFKNGGDEDVCPKCGTNDDLTETSNNNKQMNDEKTS